MGRYLPKEDGRDDLGTSIRTSGTSRRNRTSKETTRGWRKLLRPDDVVIGSIYGSADGMVRVQDKAPRGQFYGKLLQPIHTEVGKGDVFIYDWDDLYSGDGRDLEGLRDYILDGVKHKNVDDVNIHPRMNEEEILLY